MSGLVIDTSAIIAILRDEPKRHRFVDAILAAESRLMSAVSLQEAGIVIAGRSGNDTTLKPLEALLSLLDIMVVAHDSGLARLAWQAFLRFGKGRHPARLNFADCAVYALAKSNNLPLLFKGEDFAATDIVAAITISD
ncbi:MAG: type II toxin-antitoxin system VapC family toxin [Rhodopila sp.]